MTINAFLRNSNKTFNMPEKTETPIMSFVGLMSEIKRGNIRIPDFQRSYIWSPEQVLELLDSIWNGYPIGSILLWKTSERMNERDPLNLRLPELSKDAERLYLLDGQQRLITLYAVIHDMLELGKKRKIKYKVYFDLKNNKFKIYKKKDLEGSKNKPKIEDYFLPMNELMEINYKTRSANQNNSIITKFSKNPEMLQAYIDLFIRFNSLEVPAITNAQGLKIATKIFERLNNTGTPLTIVDLMVATTYTTKFNLRNKLSDLNSELDSIDFKILDTTILQCMSACLKGGTTRDDIIDSSLEIEKKWKKNVNALKMAISFLRKNCSVPVSRFLPNEILLAPLTYFFCKYGNKQLHAKKIKKLKRYFWFGVLSERYIQSQDSRAEEDIKNMNKILEGNEKSDIFNYKPMIFKDFIKYTEVSFSSSFAKALLCFLASKRPLEFRNNVFVDLQQHFVDADLKTLHHIFPQDFIKNNLSEKQKEFINSIANISLISKTTNSEIWNTKPSIYFTEFEKDNKELPKALKTHLIGDLDKFGIRNDNFNKFLDERSKLIEKEIKDLIEELEPTSQEVS